MSFHLFVRRPQTTMIYRHIKRLIRTIHTLKLMRLPVKLIKNLCKSINNSVIWIYNINRRRCQRQRHRHLIMVWIVTDLHHNHCPKCIRFRIIMASRRLSPIPINNNRRASITTISSSISIIRITISPARLTISTTPISKHKSISRNRSTATMECHTETQITWTQR